MPRRHDSLIPLTHDHHHTLAQARKLKDAARSSEADVREVAGGFLDFYLGSALRHFHEEEELFFAPLIDHPEARDPVLRAVSDHLRVHALARTVKRQLSTGDIDTGVLEEISKLLTDHVRFEEQELFPIVERLIPEENLLDLATAGRRDV